MIIFVFFNFLAFWPFPPRNQADKNVWKNNNNNNNSEKEE
jgi:hypothetical protein